MPTKHLGTGDSFASYIDLTQQELRNARIQNLAAAPGSPVAGQVYYDTVLLEFRFWNGTSWINCDGSSATLLGDVTGTVGATTVGKINGVVVSAAAANIAAELANAATRSATATVAAGEETVYTGSTSAQTLTLPVTPQGSTVNVVVNTSSVSVTVAAGAGNTINNYGTVGSLTLAVGEEVQMVFVGTVWYCIAIGTSVRAALATAASTYLPLSGGTFTGNLVSNGTAKVTALPTPTSGSDAATKGYVDGVAQGLSAKPSVTVVATTPLSAAPATGGLLTVDGVTLTAGQRVLAVAQATASQNGIWVAAVGAWARPTDFATGAVEQGTYVLVEQGTASSGTGWVMTGAAVTVDTTAETWVQFSKAATGISKYSAFVGGSTSITVTHSLNTPNVQVSVYDSTGTPGGSSGLPLPGNAVQVDYAVATANTITLTFQTAPAANAYLVVVTG